MTNLKKQTEFKPIRVLHALDHLAQGGIETAMMMIYRGINREKIQFDFLVRNETPGAYDEEVRKLGGRVICVSGHKNPFTYRKKVIRSIESHGPFAAFHSHLGYYNGFLIDWADKARIPIRIAHVHNILQGTQGNVFKGIYHQHMRRMIYRHANRGLAISTDAADTLYGPSWRKDNRFNTISYGLNLVPFKKLVQDRLALRRKFNIPENAVVIGHVGRFDPQKNHPFWLEIVAKLMERNPDIWAVLVGKGGLEAEIRSKADELSISDRLIITGTRDDVPAIMRNVFDLFLFPSLFEGLGLVLIEAQAAGIHSVFSSTLPSEVDVNAHLLHRTSLDLSADKWADKVETALKLLQPSTVDAISVIEKSDFNLDRVVQFYEGLYLGNVQ